MPCLAVLLAGCGSTPDAPPAGTSTSATTTDARPDDAASTGEPMTEHAAGDIVTATDLPSTLRLAPGEEATLRLAPPLQDAPAVSADPGVVELVPVDHLVDPGYAEYQLLAQAPGATTVTVGGTDDHPEDVVLEVVVDR